jgi:ribosomal peptide maturation radical SAM protein 1
VDNILDMRYFRDFIPMLAERRLGVELFYEVKANLKKDQVRLLRQAGVTTIQPGIESLSDSVLQLMRKGVSALQNIQLLKWCEEIGTVPEWNLLWGFPGESEEEYYRMANLISLITHLTPPRFATTVRLDRFSPNYNESQELGLRDVSPYPAYSYVYPFGPEVLQNLAYFFAFDYGVPQDVENYVKPLEAEIARWQECHSSSKLFVIDKEEFALICDFRPISVQPLIVLTGHERLFYLACDEIRTAQQLMDLWDTRYDGVKDIQWIKSVLEDFVARGIMIRRGDSYLALAVKSSLVAGTSDGLPITQTR